MPLATYAGPNESRELWGVKFPQGVAVEVNDALANKCRCLGFFVEDAPKPAPMVVEDTDARQIEALGVVLAAPVLSEVPAVVEPAPKKRGRPRKAS